LAEVALVDVLTCAATGDVSASWWHEKVRIGEAPAPAIRAPRCTRWRAVEVATFWREFAAKAAANTEARERVTAKAKAASVKAREPAAVAKAQATRKAKAAVRTAQRAEAA
jgi:hypothetical protein